MKRPGSSWLSVAGAAMLTSASCGCALNLSEARPARVLRGGEMQVSQVSNLVVPAGNLENLVSPVRSIAESFRDQESVSEDEQQDAVLGATAVALQGPGYSTHVEFGIGLGYRYDLAARMGNGIYGVSVRRGFDLEHWDANLGGRVAYNSGSSWIPYADELNDIFRVAELDRMDSQLFSQVGREWGDWFRLWFGAKAMLSVYRLRVNGVVSDEVSSHLWYGGPFVGAALGYRYLFLVGELMVLRSWGEVDIAGFAVDLSGFLVVPAWGVRVNF